MCFYVIEEPTKCEDKSPLCTSIDREKSCIKDEVQNQCPKLCNTCKGTKIQNGR